MPGVKFNNVLSLVKTAGGENHRILGHILASTTFQNKTSVMRLHIASNLSQKLYLGMDFWKLFGKAPAIVEELGLDIRPVVKESPEKVDPNIHLFIPEQKTRRNNIVHQFPSCETLGLGKTYLDVGSVVPVKQCYYEVSPAVQRE